MWESYEISYDCEDVKKSFNVFNDCDCSDLKAEWWVLRLPYVWGKIVIVLNCSEQQQLTLKSYNTITTQLSKPYKYNKNHKIPWQQ